MKHVIREYILRPDYISLRGVGPASASIDMPRGATPLSVAVHGEEILLWAMVDPDALSEIRNFCVVTNDVEFGDVGRFIGTLVLPRSDIAMHVFEAL